MFGIGGWGRRWFDDLLELARRGLIELTVVDLYEEPPDVLKDPLKEGLVRYLPWDKALALPDLEIAIVVVPAKKHAEVIETILDFAQPKWVLCEKTAGDSLSDFCRILDACERKGSKFVMCDHYILRKAVQHLLHESEKLAGLGEVSGIEAYMIEEKATGPDQEANKDMLIHTLDVVHILFPRSEFIPSEAFISQAKREPNADVTYTLSFGGLRFQGKGEGLCLHEVGKQLFNRKEIIIKAEAGTLKIDLTTNRVALFKEDGDEKEWYRSPNVWSYKNLILKVINDSAVEELPIFGALPPLFVLRSWIELEEVRRMAKELPPYERGRLPRIKEVMRV